MFWAQNSQAGMLDLQTQLYILSATFGAVIFLLILLVLVLALSVARWVPKQIYNCVHNVLKRPHCCPFCYLPSSFSLHSCFHFFCGHSPKSFISSLTRIKEQLHERLRRDNRGEQLTHQKRTEFQKLIWMSQMQQFFLFKEKLFQDVSTTAEMPLDMKMAASAAPGTGTLIVSTFKNGHANSKCPEKLWPLKWRINVCDNIVLW